MFLPIVMLQKYGWPGFFLFAIPNVIGCTAFGYVVRTPERSKALVEKYGTAMAIFAIVTIAFHAFFVAMIVQMQHTDSGAMTIIGIAMGLLIVGGLLATLHTRFWPIVAVGLWIFSAIVGITLLPFEAAIEGTRPWQDVIWFMPITTLGFLLCPYLDPTFHRAIQETPSKHSFAVFGITFACLIAMTCLYYDDLQRNRTILLTMYLGAQTVFTVGVHFKEGCRIASKFKKLFVVLAIIASTVAIGIAIRPHGDDGLVKDYLRFFAFYGFVFPGLVAIFMLTKQSFTPKRLALFSLVTLLSLPLLEAGYIGESPWFTILPVVVLLTWVFTNRRHNCCTNE